MEGSRGSTSTSTTRRAAQWAAANLTGRRNFAADAAEAAGKERPAETSDVLKKDPGGYHGNPAAPGSGMKKAAAAAQSGGMIRSPRRRKPSWPLRAAAPLPGG